MFFDKMQLRECQADEIVSQINAPIDGHFSLPIDTDSFETYL